MLRVSLLILALGGCDLVFELNETPPCPTAYEQYPTGRYRLVSTERSWIAAEGTCRADSGGANTHLVVIADLDEYTLISTLAEGVNGGAEIYIGLSDREVEGTMAWVSSENEQIAEFGKLDDTFPWINGEPNNGGGGSSNEDCAALPGGSNAPLNDINCNQERAFICECDAFSSDATP